MSRSMKTAGMILSAGLGERMRPLTSLIPKPMVTITGVPVFEVTAEKLLREGASSLHANLFHLGGILEKFAAGKGWPITFYREKELLGTGGGIGNMIRGLAGADLVLLANADIVSNIPIRRAISFHIERKALFTMILAESDKRGRAKYAPPARVRLKDDLSVDHIASGAAEDEDMKYGYTGLAVFSPQAFDFFPRGEKACLVDILNRMTAKLPGSVAGFVASGGETIVAWGEAGTPSSLISIHERILVGRESFDPLLKPPPLPIRFSEGAKVDPGAAWKGFLDVGRDSFIEKDTYLENCVVMPDTKVPTGTRAKNSVIFNNVIMEAD